MRRGGIRGRKEMMWGEVGKKGEREEKREGGREGGRKVK